MVILFSMYRYKCKLFYSVVSLQGLLSFFRHPVVNNMFLYDFIQVKDLVARIDIKWQILLHGTKPLDVRLSHTSIWLLEHFSFN